MTARLAAIGAVFVLLLAWTHARPQATPAAVDFSAIPLTFDNWTGRDAPPLDPAVARALAADQYVHRYYGPRRYLEPGGGTPEQLAARRVEMDIAYYARPQAGATMHSPLSCLPGNGWQIIESRMTAVPLANGGEVDVRRLVVGRGNDRVAMTYWFQNRGAVVGQEYGQRLQFLANGLRGRPTDAALVRVMALDTREGRTALAAFTRELIARLRPLLPA